MPRAATPPPPPDATTWRYTGTITRVYTNIPVTINPGDTIAWPNAPTDDGNWEPAEDTTPTRQPDNQPQQG